MVLPFSTDQFANAADLERLDGAAVASPNTRRPDELADTISRLLAGPAPHAVPRPTVDELVGSLGIAA